jgi:hypothetical protein
MTPQDQNKIILACTCIHYLSKISDTAPCDVIEALTGTVLSEEDAGYILQLMIETEVELMFEMDPEGARDLIGDFFNDNT